MKKVFILFAMCAGMMSCTGNQVSSVESADTTAVDTVVVDTASVDTVCNAM